MMLTKSISCSFVDRDMFMRHFGHGVGHLQYERQHEIEHDDHDDGEALEDDSDSTDSLDHTGDSDPEDDIMMSDIIGDSDSDGSYSDGYASL